MRASIFIGLICLLPLGVFGAPSAREQAMESLADGDTTKAARLLRGALDGRKDTDEGAAVRCLLGHVLRQGDRDAEAAKVLGAVPESADCYRQAALTRADALRALGRVEQAADLYEQLGGRALGTERELPMARWLVELSASARAADAHGRADRLLALALDRVVSPAQAMALVPWPVVVERALQGTLDSTLRERSKALLLDRLAATTDDLKRATLRRDLAPLLAGNRRLAVLEGLEGEAVELLRVRFLIDLDLDAAARRLADRDGPVARQLAQSALQASRHDLAIPILKRLAAGTASGARDASRQLAKAHAEIGGAEAAIQVLSAHLVRFKRDPLRAEIEAEIDQLAMGIARRLAATGKIDAARAAFLALSESSRSAQAASANLAAAALALDAGDWKAARAGLRDTMARWPQSAAGQEAAEALVYELLQRGDVEGLDRIGAERPQMASRRASLEEAVELTVTAQRQRPGADARVSVTVRNVKAVSAKLHRIDSEAFFGAGLDPARLADLDVAVVAPDREWTVPVPRYRKHASVRFDLAVPKPKPGLYRLTLGGGDKEASVVLVVSDLDLVVQGVADSLLLLAARGGIPVAGVEVRARVGQTLVKAKTDRQGLARLQLPPGPVTVWARHKGSVALASLDRDEADSDPRSTATMELDRTLYAPGDTVHFALQGFTGQRPLTGLVEVRLELDGISQPPAVLTLSAAGFASGQIRLPDTPASGAATARRFALHALLPGSETPVRLAAASVASPTAVGPRLHGWMAEDTAVLRVVDALGRGLKGVPLRWMTRGGDAHVVHTDAAGRVVLQGPQIALPWHVDAKLIGLAGRRTSLSRVSKSLPQIQVRGPHRVAAGAPVALTLSGVEGAVELKVLRYTQITAQPPVRRPWAAAVGRAFDWAKAPDTAAESSGPTVLIKVVPVSLKDAVGKTSLALPPGRYLVVASALSGGLSAPGQWTFSVEAEAPWLEGLASVGLGQRLTGTLRGPDWALVTVASERRLLDARLVKRGASVSWPVKADWPAWVQVAVASTTGARTEQTVDVDSSARVELTASEASGEQLIEVVVKDRMGAPIAGADVLVAARTSARTAPASLRLEAAEEGFEWWAALFVGSVNQSVLATQIAAGLLQEHARNEERKRAQQARGGSFSGSKLAEMDKETVMYSPDVGGLGMSGFGSVGGGGGMGGRGRGRAQMRQGRSVVRGNTPPRVRALGHWEVLKTDAKGRVRTRFTPSARGKWRVVARVSSVAGRGEAALEIDPAQHPRLLFEPAGPAGPGAEIEAVFDVVAGAQPLKGTVVFGDAQRAVELAAFQTGRVSFGPQRPGTRRQVVLKHSAGRLTADWAAPFDVDRISPDGALVHGAIGAGGKPPTSWLAQRPAAGDEPIHFVRRARAALAALPAASKAEAVLLREIAMQARLSLRHRRRLSGGIEKAEAALFLAEAEALLGVPSGELETAFKALPLSAADPKIRAWLMRARAVAGRKVEAGFAARLLADMADADDEIRGVTALALLAMKDRKGAGVALGSANGPFAALARARLGLAVERAGLGRATGARGRAEWLALWAEFPPKSPRKGMAAVTLAGRSVGTLDRVNGGVISAPAGDDAAALMVDGTPAAMTWRTAPRPPKQGPKLALLRFPAGASTHRFTGSVRPFEGLTLRLGVGDRIVVPGLSTTRIPAGFTLRHRERMHLEATAPGVYWLAGRVPAEDATRGLVSTVAVKVTITTERVPAGPYTPEQVAMRRVADVAAEGRDPRPLLDATPWSEGLAGSVATRRFAWAASKGSSAEVVEAFDRVRDAAPSMGLNFEQVARVARAFREAGRVERAIDVWKVGLGQAFKAEAAVTRRVEPVAGVLVSLQGLRRLTRRYPLLAPVEEALFLAPQRLGALMGDQMPEAVKEAGITATDIRLTAAAWDREYLGLFPRSKRRAEAGFHLVGLLSELGARARSARRAGVLAGQHRGAPLLDGLLLAEGLARAALRQDKAALRLFERVASEPFPLADGTTAPSDSRNEARYAAAQLMDARGDLKAALAGYRSVEGTYPEAAAAIQALTEVSLSVSQPVVRTGSRRVEIPVRAGNLDAVELRAYRLDLTVAFLRDVGKIDTGAIRISGVNPAWRRKLKLTGGRTPRARLLAIDIGAPGAWLVQIDGGGRHASVLVIRSDLQLGTRGNRLELRLAGKPAADAELRVVDENDAVVALKTDLRGVAILPEGFQAVLARSGAHLALSQRGSEAATDDDDAPTLEFERSGRGVGRKAIERKLNRQLKSNKMEYEQNFRFDAPASVEAMML